MKQLSYSKKEYEIETEMPKFSKLVFDIEVYPNYVLIAFKNIATGKIMYFEKSREFNYSVDFETLSSIMYFNTVIGFNSNCYDLPILWAVVKGTCVEYINDLSQQIIANERYDEKEWGKIPETQTIDLIEVAPLKASLKLYGGRLGCERMQDLPYDPLMPLRAGEVAHLRDYCINDLDNTESLYNSLIPQIELRTEMGKKYGQELRSKSDAQIAETVITGEIKRVTGRYPRKPKVQSGSAITYTAPDFVQFYNPHLREILKTVQEAEYYIRDNGSIIDPFSSSNSNEESSLKARISDGVYRMGIGGLHSSETSQMVLADDDHILVDRDVASYYPSIILNLGLCPKQMGDSFLTVYREIVERRLEAKKLKNKVVADSLKIVINGSFGKFGSMYSALYSPDLLLTVTLTGQLSLLMLIEMLEYHKIKVVSANTDGIVIKVHKDKVPLYLEMVEYWEKATGFVTEETPYKAVYSRDVNNYIAVKENGFKGKGRFALPGSPVEKLQKNPQAEICADAVVALLKDGTPLHESVRSCKDILKFMMVRTVRGGAHKDGWYLGKAVRWYYGRGVKGAINYITSGNTVPQSEGAKPCMELPPEFPTDINYTWYENECQKILISIGQAQLTLF